MTDNLSPEVTLEVPGANCLEQVSLSSLAELTGFPAEFIKKELLLEDPTSMEALRASMMKYLDSTIATEIN